VKLSVIWVGVVIVVVSVVVADSMTRSVTVPMLRMDEQYSLPSSAWRSAATSATGSHSGASCATAAPAEARRMRERGNIIIRLLSIVGAKR
jgi:ABC-type Fe3+ transport system permease subunit